MPDQALAPLDVARQVYRTARSFPRIKKCSGLSPIAAGADSNIQMPTGETYLALDFICTVAGVAASLAQVIAAIDRVQMIVDGDVKIDLTGEEMVMLQYRYQQRAGVVPIGATGHLWFAFNRPWHREVTGEDDPAWGTADVRNFEIVISMNASAAVDAITINRIVTDGEPMGRHLCIRKKPRNFASAALERISEWKREIGTQLLAIHVKETHITDVKLTVDDVIEMDCKYQLLVQQALQYERSAYAGFQTIDFAVRGRLKDGMPMIAQTMDLDLTWSSAPNAYKLILEQIEGPARTA